MLKSLLPALAGLALLTTGAHAQDMLTLKLATGEVDINPTANSILKLAARLGFYEKHGVKVEIVELDGTPQSVAALDRRQRLESGALGPWPLSNRCRS